MTRILKCVKCSTVASGTWVMQRGRDTMYGIPLCAEHGFQYAIRVVESFEREGVEETSEMEKMEMAFVRLRPSLDAIRH